MGQHPAGDHAQGWCGGRHADGDLLARLWRDGDAGDEVGETAIVGQAEAARDAGDAQVGVDKGDVETLARQSGGQAAGEDRRALVGGGLGHDKAAHPGLGANLIDEAREFAVGRVQPDPRGVGLRLVGG